MLPVCNCSTSFILHFTWGMNTSSVEYYIASHVTEVGILIRAKLSIFKLEISLSYASFFFF